MLIKLTNYSDDSSIYVKHDKVEAISVCSKYTGVWCAGFFHAVREHPDDIKALIDEAEAND